MRKALVSIVLATGIGLLSSCSANVEVARPKPNGDVKNWSELKAGDKMPDIIGRIENNKSAPYFAYSLEGGMVKTFYDFEKRNPPRFNVLAAYVICDRESLSENQLADFDENYKHINEFAVVERTPFLIREDDAILIDEDRNGIIDLAYGNYKSVGKNLTDYVPDCKSKVPKKEN